MADRWPGVRGRFRWATGRRAERRTPCENMDWCVGRRFQVTLNRRMPWLFMNILAFSWAMALCALAMFAMWAILAGQDILPFH